MSKDDMSQLELSQEISDAAFNLKRLVDDWTGIESSDTPENAKQRGHNIAVACIWLKDVVPRLQDWNVGYDAGQRAEKEMKLAA